MLLEAYTVTATPFSTHVHEFDYKCHENGLTHTSFANTGAAAWIKCDTEQHGAVWTAPSVAGKDKLLWVTATVVTPRPPGVWKAPACMEDSFT
jgi:hypothetical protein